MKRYFVELSYDGTDFFGWQKQPKQISVQEVIEEALTRLNSNAPIAVVGCGRTDTGVHAHHYVLHFDMADSIDGENWMYKLNKMLPASVAIHSIKEVTDELHARFSATDRTYRYFIHTKKDPFIDNYSWLVNQKLDFDKMNEAAALLIGQKDFTSFSKLHTDVKTNICDVRYAMWHELEEGKAYFEIRADRFLRNMVRATVGTLVDVGLGKLDVQDIPTVLEEKDRGAASVSVPGKGLFLWKIEY